jgi:hypothetical protein
MQQQSRISKVQIFLVILGWNVVVFSLIFAVCGTWLLEFLLHPPHLETFQLSFLDPAFSVTVGTGFVALILTGVIPSILIHQRMKRVNALAHFAVIEESARGRENAH